MTLVDTKKSIPIEKRYDNALCKIDRLETELTETRKENKILEEENSEYSQQVIESDQNSDAMRSKVDDLELRLKMDQTGRKLLPLACIATATSLALGAYVLLTETPVGDYVSKWLNSYQPQGIEYQDSK